MADLQNGYAPGARLSITLLGSPAIVLDGAPARGFVSSKAAALVYYLAATGRAHTREALAGLLWGEASEAQANKNLRDVLSNLRRLLDPYLQITRQMVSFAPDGAELVDSRRFEARAEAARRQQPAAAAEALREAAALYGGDFLEGFSLADAPAFEEWATIQREQLRRLFMDVLHSLATEASSRNAYAEAIDYAARMLALDPTREEAHRQKMLLLALSGQRSAALAQYEACRRVLNDELGLDPDEETEALQRRILVGEVGAEPSTPAVAAAARPHYALPAPLAAFIGRAAELDQIVAQLRERTSRLITITGAGGVGKTRLALQAAHQLLPASQQGAVFAHGIVFVGLAAVGAGGWGELEAEQAIYPILAARIADVLSLTFSGPEAPHVQLGHYLREKQLLLILDNCEHLALTGFVVELLEQAPGLTMLVTSRGRLNVPGEHVAELSGLSFPSRREIAAQTDLDTYSALQLFRHNAQLVNPRLDWVAEAAAAARVCELVAGLPLGIELAASLVRLMPCQEIAREIEANLNFLQSVRRDVPERHQSLQAVFDHSWKLLNTAEQRALQQLAVFRGSFDREAAARVAGTTLPLLASLVDNSLVRRVASQGAAGRYELQELVRQYTTEKMVAQSDRDEQMAVLDRHCRYYLGLLSQRKADLRGRRQAEALAEINLEIENIRSAWRWALAEGHVQLINQACDSLFYFYETRGWFQEGAEVFALAARRLSDLNQESPPRESEITRGKLLAHQGWCAFQVGRQAEARGLLQQSLAILRQLEAHADLVLPLNYLAAAAYYSGDYTEAEQLVTEALQLSLAYHERHGAAVAKTILGQIAYLVGHYEDARQYSQESIAIERELGNRWGIVFALISLGRVNQALGEYEEARRAFQEGLAIREMLGDARGIALCLDHLGDTEEALGNHSAARQRYQESLARLQEIGHQAGAATALTKLGYNALATHDSLAAGAYFREALRMAWASQAIPRTLDALVGIATVLAANDSDQAGNLAALAHSHPAATQQSRDRAANLLEQLGMLTNQDRRAASQTQHDLLSLQNIVAAALSQS